MVNLANCFTLSVLTSEYLLSMITHYKFPSLLVLIIGCGCRYGSWSELEYSRCYPFSSAVVMKTIHFNLCTYTQI